MAAALRADGVESEVAILPGDEHGYEVGARVFDRTLDFLEGRTVEETAVDLRRHAVGPIVAAGAGVLGVLAVGVVCCAVAAGTRGRLAPSALAGEGAHLAAEDARDLPGDRFGCRRSGARSRCRRPRGTS